MPSVLEFILLILALMAVIIVWVIWRYYRSIPSGSRVDPADAWFRAAGPAHNRSGRR